ncbi:hypothetical protein [Kalamiella sp. sgz302252]|uniref:hypothetical protein n=1 Tax=Pantoea sp. sgz302252 TaxID=3341827 RepID=UPI0036D25E1D
MAWDRKKTTVMDLPEEPSLILWLIAGVTALVAGVVLFVLHANNLSGILQKYNLWLISAGPLFAWFILMCLRGWRYNCAFEKYQFEKNEAAYAQQQWTEWAGRYMAVLYNGVILPEYLTPATFLQAPAALEQHINQTRRINFKEGQQGLSLLLKGVRQSIARLPLELQLDVLLLTDAADDELSLQKVFAEAWRQNFSPERPVPVVQIMKSKSFLHLDEHLKSPGITAELILVQQTQGEDKYSDAFAALLLVSDDLAAKYKFSCEARILRPMPLDMINLHKELDVFFSTQKSANFTQCIIGDRVRWGSSFPALLKASEDYGGRWNVDQLHWLETYAGISGPFSPWVMAAVISDIVRIELAACLLLAVEEDQSFITTVTTGNKNNDNG